MVASGCLRVCVLCAVSGVCRAMEDAWYVVGGERRGAVHGGWCQLLLVNDVVWPVYYRVGAPLG